MQHFLPIVLILIFTAVFVVLVFKKINLSPVLGYLVAGGIIGDYGLKIISFKETTTFAEYGVVFLLFAIGLELSFERLMAMRKYVFGLGSLQVLITTIVISSIVILFLDDYKAAIIIGGGLALSSTAIVLQILEENRLQLSQTGRISLSILLQQDFVVVPLLVIVPLLAQEGNQVSILYAIGISFLKAILALISIFIAGGLIIKPIFRFISATKTASSNELFVATTILIALSAAFTTEYLGLSLALGAFVAGILVAETEFRLMAEQSIYPFKGLLLGLFFMSIGMKIDIREVYSHIWAILVVSFSLILIKSLIIMWLCIFFGFSKGKSLQIGLLLSQGSEFSFILFDLAIDNHIISQYSGGILLIVITLSMAVTPMLMDIGDRLKILLDNKDEKQQLIDNIQFGASDLTEHVIIAGFGKVGKMIANLLSVKEINYIALDINEKTVNEAKETFPIFLGDINQLAVLQAAGSNRAIAMILTMNNYVTIKKALKTISNNFPSLSLIVKTHDLSMSTQLYEAGATILLPSDYEIGLQLGSTVLKVLGVSEYEINRVVNQFRAGNYVTATQYTDPEEEKE